MADAAAGSGPGTDERRSSSAELELQLEESLRLARAQLTRIRGNLALVVGFLTRPEP